MQKKYSSCIQSQTYKCYYYQNQPYSLTITKKPMEVYNQLFEAPQYIWILQNQHEIQNIKKMYSSHIRANLTFAFSAKFTNLKIKNNKNIVFICKKQIVDQLLDKLTFIKNINSSTNPKPKIISIIIHSILDLPPSVLSLPNILIQLTHITTYEGIFQKITNKYSHNTSKQYTNFISLEKQAWDSNILLKTMFSMIKQKTCRECLLKEFQQLAKLVTPDLICQIQLFVSQYRDKNYIFDMRTAIQWYTDERFLFRFLNRILRCTKDPTCLYIVQFYIKDLFDAISKLYIEQQNEKVQNGKINMKKFKCYRGGYLSQKQFNFFKQNKNCVVQSLGFMSTSLYEVTARKFIGNAFFQIQVQDKKRHPELDFGFAFVENYSKTMGQDQILFNSLNSFNITDVGFLDENKNIYKITLKYGWIVKFPTRKIFTEKQLSQKKFIQYQLHHNRVGLCMIQILIQNQFNLQGSQYCHIFLEIAEKAGIWQNIIYAHFIMGLRFKNQCNYKLMISQYLKAYEISKQHKNQEKIWFVRSLQLLIRMFILAGEFGKAALYFQQYENIKDFENFKLQSEIDSAIFFNNLAAHCIGIDQYYRAFKYLDKSLKIFSASNDSSPYLYTTLSNLAVIYQNLLQFPPALHYFQYCLTHTGKIFGQNHPFYTVTLNNMGTLYSELGQLNNALSCLQKCLKIRKRMLGKNHPDYGITLFNLGSIARKFGDFQKSKKYFLQGKQIISKNKPQYKSIIQNLQFIEQELNLDVMICRQDCSQGIIYGDKQKLRKSLQQKIIKFFNNKNYSATICCIQFYKKKYTPIRDHQISIILAELDNIQTFILNCIFRQISFAYDKAIQTELSGDYQLAIKIYSEIILQSYVYLWKYIPEVMEICESNVNQLRKKMKQEKLYKNFKYVNTTTISQQHRVKYRREIEKISYIELLQFGQH